METESTQSDPYLLCTSKNKRIILNQPKFTIGRGLNNSYVIEDIKLSRTHCIFEEKDGAWYIMDLSSNGTLVNKKRIRPKAPKMLTGGDVITLTDCYELVFVNMRTDSLDNLDLSGVIDSAEISLIDRTVKVVTTSDVNKFLNVNQKTSASYKLSDISNSAAAAALGDDINTGNIKMTSFNNSNKELQQINSERTEPVASASSTSDSANETNKPAELPQTICNRLEQAENELQCIICTELFIKATTLNCSHSFCKHCLELWRKKNKNCPICRTKITTANPTIVLDNFISTVLESGSEDMKAKRAEVIKSRAELPSTKQTTSKKTRASRSRVTTPITISSDDDSYDDDDFIDDDDIGIEMDEIPGHYYGGYGRCYTCGRHGHWANGCPYS